MEQFRKLGLSEAMLGTLASRGFHDPTPIQKAVIPMLLSEGMDVVAQAETGTGKTAAFGIPIIESLAAPDGSVRALVVVPTRELAIQAAREIGSLGGGRGVRVVPVYGGQPFGPQRTALKQGRTSWSALPALIWTTWKKRPCAWTGSPTWCWTRQTKCWTWVFGGHGRDNRTHATTRRTLLFSATMPRGVIT